jgi:hypothetical protein
MVAFVGASRNRSASVHELVFEAGEYIYRRGDTPDFAFVIVSGEVEIRWPEHMRAPTRLGKGEIFGQIGIMIDQPRRRSAQAASTVTAVGISRKDFLSEFNARLDVVEPFLRRLFATLHEVDTLLEPAIDVNPETTSPPPRDLAPPSENAAPPPAAPSWTGPDEEPPAWHSGAEPVVSVAGIRISAASPKLGSVIGIRGIAVDELPFRVGRKPVRGESLPPGGLHLILEDVKPFNLSRRHFSIELGEAAPFVRDTGSHLGTVVNGMRIGGNANTRVASLQPGENEIVAGADGSPFVFTVHLAST